MEKIKDHKQEQYIELLFRLEGVLDIMKIHQPQEGNIISTTRNILDLMIKDMDDALDSLYEYQDLVIREKMSGEDLVNSLKEIKEETDKL